MNIDLIRNQILTKFGTYSKCAEALNISPSTLSRLLQKPSYKFLQTFPDKHTGKLFNYSKDGLDFFNRALKRLNLPAYSIHDLRRKFGTTLAEKGLTPYELQKLMRHQNIRTTMQYYINIDLQNIAKKM